MKMEGSIHQRGTRTDLLREPDRKREIEKVEKSEIDYNSLTRDFFKNSRKSLHLRRFLHSRNYSILLYTCIPNRADVDLPFLRVAFHRPIIGTSSSLSSRR